MTILVTGGTGLVGTRLLPRLVEAGFDVRALVRRGKTLPAGVTAVEGDVLDPSSLQAATQGVEAIVHLAAVFRGAEPEQIWAVNHEGTRNLIAAAHAYAPAARFVMASTGLVYGDGGTRPAREGDEVAPNHDYPASKVASEKLLRDSGLTWSILRFGFVYGDGDGHVDQIPRIAQMLNAHPARRLSMIHHRDIATFVKMGLSGELDGRIVNTVDEAPMTFAELSEMAGSPMPPSAAGLDNPWAWVLDGKLGRSLGFKPEVATIWQAAREGAL